MVLSGALGDPTSANGFLFRGSDPDAYKVTNRTTPNDMSNLNAYTGVLSSSDNLM